MKDIKHTSSKPALELHVVGALYPSLHPVAPRLIPAVHHPASGRWKTTVRRRAWPLVFDRAAAYGWQDLTKALKDAEKGTLYDFKDGGCIQLDAGPEGFAQALAEYEKTVDEQIRERLLALNLERAAEEAKAAKVKKPKVQRGKAEGELI